MQFMGFQKLALQGFALMARNVLPGTDELAVSREGESNPRSPSPRELKDESPGDVMDMKIQVFFKDVE